MNMVFTIVLIFHVLVAATIIGLVLIQHGKGAEMGAAFGSGSSGSLFGATGSANFLSRTTAVLATLFFITSIALTWIASRPHTLDNGSVMRGVSEPATVPASPVPGGDVQKDGSKSPSVPAAGDSKAPAAAGDAPKRDEVPK